MSVCETGRLISGATGERYPGDPASGGRPMAAHTGCEVNGGRQMTRRGSAKRQEREREIEEIINALPEEPDTWAQQMMYDDGNIAGLAPWFLLVERVSMVEDTYPIERVMDPEKWERHERGMKHYWGAQGKCTFCGSTYEGAWKRVNGSTRIELEFAEDLETYRDGSYAQTPWVEIGDNVTCLYCSQPLTVQPKSRFRRGATYRQPTITVERFGDWGGLIYWMQEIHMDAKGDVFMEAFPREALVVSRRGKLLRFSKTEYRKNSEKELPYWTHRRYDKPLYEIQYASDDEDKGRCCDSMTVLHVEEDLDGVTAEKTGFNTMFREFSCYFEDQDYTEPEDYLRLWEKHPAVENLVKAGWKQLVREIMFQPKTETAVNWQEVKPHRMLGMTKEELRGCGEHGWGLRELEAWKQYNAGEAYIGTEKFDKYWNKYSAEAVKTVARMADGSGRWNLQKIERYLKRQGMSINMDDNNGLQFLIDYRYAAQQMNALHTERDFWPKDLPDMHDRMTAALALTAEDQSGKMQELAQKLQALSWSDGRYCIRAADSAAELTQEGKTLKHCVGGYAQKHVQQTDVIFFVRKARRPERSWLTLDINLSRGMPAEVQLHGYHNEWIGDKLIPIPQRGRAFVDRWKKEILIPWAMKRFKEQAQKGEKAS